MRIRVNYKGGQEELEEVRRVVDGFRQGINIVHFTFTGSNGVILG